MAGSIVDHNYAGQDLQHQDLSFRDLRGANFHRADLRGANLEGSDLLNANLRTSYLQDATLKNANLEQADFGYAELIKTDLSGANLKDAILSEAVISFSVFQGADLTRAVLLYAYGEHVDFSNANLTGANLTCSELSNINLVGTNLTQTIYVGAKITTVNDKGTLNLQRKTKIKEQLRIQNTNSPEFKRWFANSVVVDKNGKPLVVYHGTTRGGFTTFDLDLIKAHQGGFFFTDNIAVAESYTTKDLPYNRPDPALDTKEKTGIYRAYLKLTNPLVVQCNGESWNRISNAMNPNFTRTSQWARWARIQGYDSLILKNVRDDGSKGFHRAELSTIFCVFDPKSIKSATANNGNYDPKDLDIRHNPAPQPSSAATVILDDKGRALVLRRGPTAPWMPGKWSLPGGNVDPGEGLVQAAAREVAEETSLVLYRATPLAVRHHRLEEWSCAFFLSKFGEWRGKVDLNYENDAFAWISERDIDRYDFIPTVVDALREAFRHLR